MEMPGSPSKGGPEGEASLNSGPVANPLALRHERLTGTVSKYSASSGWGFVRSHLFEGELAFKAENIMTECQNHDFQENEAVEFDVQSDERGRPHAVALKPMVGRKPQDCIGQRHRGYVRRFADRWGFLNAAAFDGDLFVHRDNLLLAPEQMQDGQPPLRAGQAVEFDVAADDRGRTVAKQITTSALPRPCDWVGRRLHGYVRSFQGAWGFINSDRFAGDLFIHSDSVLPQFQGMELQVGTMVEFDVERDHHRKGGKNRLVARQVAILHQPAAAQQQAQSPYGMLPQHYPQADPMYGGVPPSQATPYAPVHTPPVYYPNPATHAGAGLGQDLSQQNPALGYQPPPYPYQDLSQYPPQPGQAMPQYGQQPPMMPPGSGYGQPPVPQPVPGQYQAYGGQPCGQPVAQGVPAYSTDAARTQVPPPQQPEAYAGSAPTGPAPAEGGEQPQVLLHITTHDWEPDQSGQLRVRKGTLVNVSHRAAHGWVYAATVQPGGESGEPVAEGWVPQAVAKRVSLCRVAVDWPAEGTGTLDLVKGDLIAVSKEADRGWVYGERISPRRLDQGVDGWLPKKVLEYILH
mmetsp:Transcript_49632/g.105648  ORF Transcript_49632/g.105648 Transcript_49632/m.105648 type:complete len:575 (+) Transcript_49632:178-1902(+)|eukprot:CAMPEP_0206514324 /NCGR_PEP_ID=MMETSP0324_2-20121206/62051_1 /ASSEMBLY_ACC=CAM_ASM_000836 /TAXON_ID=2866 /ORGANISM="Crypthecodinium cohnii, Strain Seligo" /LENGTH=574 /DNA_ID=CAMNT_0054006739 /DNA_START=121 /DNA_END=1845 /DNA_ORIENTATION=+